MKYYELHKSTNSKEIGVFPQAGLNINHNRHDAQSPTKLKSMEMPTFEPNFNDLEIDENAFFTDYVSSGLSLYGMFLSQKMYKIISEFRVQPHKVYELNIKNSNKNYLWLHFGKTQILETVDYSNSEFKIDEFGFEKERISLSDFTHYKVKQKEMNSMSVIKAVKLCLKIEPINDLFIIPFLDGNIYLSQILVEKLEEMNLTGLQVNPSQLVINPADNRVDG